MPILTSTITCPTCRARIEATMPDDSCQFFWECPQCRVVSRPLKGDCCVFFSYGDVPCPPVQESAGGDARG